MFGGLREKLQAARNRLASSIQAVAAPAGTPGPESSRPQFPDKSPEQGKPDPSGPKSVGFVDKVRTFIIERELIVSEKDVADSLSELEITLLECDVALPATDAIIGQVRKGLVGQHRKIGESVDSLVVNALKTALIEVLGNGFDLSEYIRNHDKPVKILFTGVNGTGKTTTDRKSVV